MRMVIRLNSFKHFAIVLIGIFLIACSNKTSNEANGETVGNGKNTPKLNFVNTDKLVDVLVENGDSKTIKLESFELGDMELAPELIGKNISNDSAYAFIKNLKYPQGFGTPIQQYCVLTDYIQVVNPVNYEYSFYRYILFEENGKFNVVREYWISDSKNSTCDMNAKLVYSTDIPSKNILKENITTISEAVSSYDGVFEGQEIKQGERVIKLYWDNQKQTAVWNVNRYGNLNNTMGIKIKRHCSDLVTVPQGKKWIVLYGIINYKFNKSDKLKTVYGPEIKIDNGRTLEPWYLEKHDKGISFAEAKDTKVKIYAGSKIRGFITPDYERADYSNAEVYFLEVNE